MSEGVYAPVMQGLDDEPAAPATPAAPAPAQAEQNPAKSEAQPPADAEQTPTDGDSGGDDPKPQGKGVARKIDRLTREKEHWQRVAQEALARQQGTAPAASEPAAQPAQAQAAADPRREDFPDYESYQRAVAEHTAQKVVSAALTKHTEAITRQQRETQARAEAARTARELEQRIATGAKDIPDWQEVLESDAPLAPHLIPLLAESDVPARVLHYLHRNPNVADELSSMSQARAALKIGAISAQLATPPTPSNAPPPGQPVGGKAAQQTSLEDMDMDDYDKARKKGRQR